MNNSIHRFSHLCYFKIFGERNTGTNYLAQLMAENFYCDALSGNTQGVYFRHLRSKLPPNVEGRLVLEKYQDGEHFRILNSAYGWKHACPPIDVIRKSRHASNTLFLVITKNPYFWVKSLYERDYHRLSKKSESLPQFLRSQWIPVVRDNLSRLVLDSPVELWRYKCEAYQRLMQLNDINVIHVRYEDLLQNYYAFLESLESLLIPKHATYTNIMQSTKKDGQTYDDYKKKYSPENINKFLTESDIEYINSIIPSELFAAFGYEKIIHISPKQP